MMGRVFPAATTCAWCRWRDSRAAPPTASADWAKASVNVPRNSGALPWSPARCR